MNHISETHAASSHTFTPTRQVWIDLVKRVAICLVVMGLFPWSGSGQIIKNAIYSFHMPLFFIMAGCTAAISASRSFSVSNFLFKRFVSVFIPYTCWCFLMGIPFSNIADLFQTYSFNDHLHTFICGDVMQWFLICLFVLHIMYAMYKFVTNKFSSVWVRLMTSGCLFVFIFLATTCFSFTFLAGVVTTFVIHTIISTNPNRSLIVVSNSCGSLSILRQGPSERIRIR